MRNKQENIYVKNLECIRKIPRIYEEDYKKYQAFQAVRYALSYKEDLVFSTYTKVNLQPMTYIDKIEFTYRDCYYFLRDYLKLGLTLSPDINLLSLAEFWQIPHHFKGIYVSELWDMMIMAFLLYYADYHNMSLNRQNVIDNMDDIIFTLNYTERDSDEN